jgi:hypothetical protein
MRVYSDAWGASLRAALATNFAALARVHSPADFACWCWPQGTGS